MATAERRDDNDRQRSSHCKPGLKGRQHSTGSIAIKLNTATSEGDWEATSQWDDPSLEFGLDARELLVSQSILKDVDVCSKSAPTSEVTTPDPDVRLLETCIEELSPITSSSTTNQLAATQNLNQLPTSHILADSQETKVVTAERSFISGIKERIQGMQDPLQAFTGKIEDFIVEKGIMDPRKSRKAVYESVDGKGMVASKSNSRLSEMTDISQHNSDSSSQFVELQDLAKQKTEQNSEVSDTSKTVSKPDNFSRHRPASFDLSGDYYEVEDDDYADAPIFDDFSQIGVFPKSCSMDTINRQLASTAAKESPKKIKSTLQKLIQPIAGRSHSPASKSSAANHGVTMSLSGLLNNSPSDAEDGSVSMEGDQFCDPQGEFVSSSSKSQIPSTDSAAELPLDKVSPTCDMVKDSVHPRPHKMTYFSTRQKLFAILVAVIAYMVMPLPAYFAGMISGAAVATAAMYAYLWWTRPPETPEPFVLPDLATLPPMEVPEMKESKNDDNQFKGWMNELYHYDKDDYHIGQTHSVLIHLEGTKLRLQTPKYNIPKRAFWDEPNYHSAVFVKQRHYDLRGAKVLLVPENLVKKRLWSKKYPICLCLPREQCSGTSLGCDVSDSKRKPIKIYLFARCTRDKEEWFRRFEAAAAGKPLPTRLTSVLASSSHTHRRMSSASSLDAFVTSQKRRNSADSNISDPGVEITPLPYCDTNHEKRLASYLRYMARVIPSESQQRLQEQAKDAAGKKGIHLPTAIRCEPQVAWVNALVTRCFWDFLREEYWVAKIREKIQKKIGKIHIPWFIDDLTVTGCELGSEMPIIRRASKPYIDDRGLWVDLDIAYTGGFRLQLETKCNLMKLKQKPSELVKVPESEDARSPITDSEEEDSAESSTDEEACEENVEDEKFAGATQTPSGSTGGKILRFVDKITQSKYFHKATEYKYIKKAMEGVSNTRLLLVVEVKNIAGPLAINIPPPPTDRLWYGFRRNPRLWLSAKPWVGEREVSLTHVTDWIEKKLAVEFQRVFVMPNMDDIPIPIMCDHLTGDKASKD